MLRSAALSRISFEQNDADWERALRKSFGGNELRREGSGVSQTSQDDEEWENWRVSMGLAGGGAPPGELAQGGRTAPRGQRAGGLQPAQPTFM